MKSNLNSVFKLLTILCCAGALVACSGVKRFTVKEFGNAVMTACGKSQASWFPSNAKGKQAKVSALLAGGVDAKALKAVLDAATKIVQSTNETGCSALITPVQCSLSCGGEHTPTQPPE